jgi:very-short-patch-repair endonuclease
VTDDAQPANPARSLVSASERRKRESPNDSAERELEFQCRSHRLPAPIWKGSTEGQFKLPKRVQKARSDGKQKHVPDRWRFDFVWPAYGLIVEVDGGIFRPGGGAHSHPVDIRRNMAKRNDAAFAGFAVLAYTPEEVRGKVAIADVIRWLAARGWTR